VVRILIETGGDFNNNFGDESYFAAMVDLFRDHFGERVEITHFTNTPQTIGRRYGVRTIYSGADLARRLKAFWPTLRAIAGCDVYVWGGGQMPHDANGVHSILYRFHRPMLARMFRKPLMSYAVGAGPLAMPASRRIVGACMNRFDLVSVRDPHSVRLLRQVGVRKQIHGTLDAALILESAPPQRVREILRAHRLPEERPFLAYVPWGWAFRFERRWLPALLRQRAHDPEERPRYEAHVQGVARALDTMVRRHDVEILLVAQDPSSRHGRDHEMVRDIAERMQMKARTRLLRGPYSPKEMKGVLGAADLVAGSRMHSLILATGGGVATCGVCFTEKTRQFARLTGQDRHCIDAREVGQGDGLASALQDAWLTREASAKRIRSWLPDAREKIVANVTRLAHLTSRAVPAPPRNIASVVRSHLCCSCGTCYAICPRENIAVARTRDGLPALVVVDHRRCRGCGLCHSVCPGERTDVDKLTLKVFKTKPTDPVLGVVRRVLLTRARDETVRGRAASGGTVSALTRFILDGDIADGVLVTGLGTTEDVMAPFSTVATSVRELSRCAGSVYQVHPTNAALRGFLDGRRLAAVGLSCQVRGLRKAALHVPAVRDSLRLTIGLFCGHNMPRQGTEHLLSCLGVLQREVSRLRYRARGMPGELLATTRNGRTVSVTMAHWAYALTVFEAARCSLCTDPFNELADVSVGDAWLPELRGRGRWNITIVRSEQGEALVRRAEAAGVIEAQPTTLDSVERSQGLKAYKRMRGAHARASLLALVGRAVPDDSGVHGSRLRRADYRRALALLVTQALFRRRTLARFFDPLIRLLRVVERRTSHKKDRLIGRVTDWRSGVFE